MMSRNLLLVAVTGALAGWLPQADAQKHLVLKDVNPQTGASQSGVNTQIPLTGNAQVDLNGDIVVNCALASGKCENIGAGSVGQLTAPSLVSFGPSTTVAANETGARLYWSTSNAHACYGLTAPAGISGWTKEWPTSTSSANGFPVGNLTRDADDPTTYNFTLRCYSSSTGTVGTTSAVAYADIPLSVTLAPSTNTPIPAGSCASYLEGLSPEERDHYDAYHAENRGFTKKEMTFQARTSKTLGVHSGVINTALPGPLGNSEYMALTFSLTATGTNTGRFSLKKQTGVGTAVPTIITISPCPGDFRPRGSSSEHYTDGN